MCSGAQCLLVLRQEFGLRLSPSELHDLVAGVGEADDPIEAIGRLGARLILQWRSWCS
jgi:hypothetical protein